MLFLVAAIVALLALAAFFSGAETALFALTPGQRESLRRARPDANRRIENLLADPPRLLGTLLLGNLLATTGISALATVVALALHRRWGWNEAVALGLGGVAVTLLILAVSEVTPKVLATRRPARLALLVVGPLLLIRLLLQPAVRLLLLLAGRFLPRRPEPAALSDDELHTMVDIGRERGVILPGEEEILASLIGIEHRTVSEVMTPRIDIIGLMADTPVRAAVAVARSSGFSRLPVWDGTPDRVTGIVYAKELAETPDSDAPVTTVARRPFFVPEVKRLLEALDELRRKGSHIAIVVDEFGQTAGLVTLEDLLEAIFGEITDEHDGAGELPWTRVDETGYLVAGEIDLASLNRLFRNAFRGTGHRRLSAFIADRLGRVPVRGDRLSHRHLEIEVRDTRGTVIDKVLIRRKA